MEKQLEILVVEDREENRRAAQEYFDTRDDVRVDFATSYDEGLRKLQEGLYAFGIFDLELPRSEGAEPEKLGFGLAREATKYAIPWAVITAGFYKHSETEKSFVRYCWNGVIPIEKIKEIESRERELGASDFLTEDGFYVHEPKKYSEPWRTIYETLIMHTPNIAETIAARERYKKIVRKQDQLDPQTG